MESTHQPEIGPDRASRGAVLAFLSLAIGCGERSLDEEIRNDTVAPTITISAPARGTMSDSLTVLVDGVVEDDVAVGELLINGDNVPFRTDGSFSHSLTLESGMTTIVTEAVDRANNRAQDTRAILAGTFRPNDELVENAILVDLSAATLDVLSDTAVAVLEERGLEAVIKAANPLGSTGNGGCFSASFDVDTFTYGGFAADMTPIAGGVSFTATITGLAANLILRWRFACVGGSANARLTADSFTVTGKVLPALDGTQLRVETTEVAGAFTNFDTEFLGIGDNIVERFFGNIDQTVADQIVKPIRESMPQALEGYVNDVMTGQKSFEILGYSASTQLQPRVLDFSVDGARLITDGLVQVAGGEVNRYWSTPSPLPEILLGDGAQVSLAIADDFVNQALSAAWAAGVANRRVDLVDEEVDVLGLRIQSVEINLPLPPIVRGTASGAAEVAIGDADVFVRNQEGAVTAHVVVSARLEVSLGSNVEGQPVLRLGQPIATAEVLADHEVPNNLNNEQIEKLLSFAITQAVSTVNGTLSSISLPGYAGTELVNPEFALRDGYLQVSADLTR